MRPTSDADEIIPFRLSPAVADGATQVHAPPASAAATAIRLLSELRDVMGAVLEELHEERKERLLLRNELAAAQATIADLGLRSPDFDPPERARFLSTGEFNTATPQVFSTSVANIGQYSAEDLTK